MAAIQKICSFALLATLKVAILKPGRVVAAEVGATPEGFEIGVLRVPCANVAGDDLIPHSERQEDVCGHVLGVSGVRGDICILQSGRQPERCMNRVVERVNQIVSRPQDAVDWHRRPAEPRLLHACMSQSLVHR